MNLLLSCTAAQPAHTIHALPHSNAQPYADGLLVQLCLSPQAAQRLRKHPLLAALLPAARWVGDDA